MATQNPIELLVTLGINSNESRRNIQSSLDAIQRQLNLNVNATANGSANATGNNATQQIRQATQAYGGLTQQTGALSAAQNQASRSSNNLGDSLANAYKKFSIWSVASTTIFGAVKGLQDLTQRVIELDTALTDLRRVSDLDEFTFNTVIERAIENVDNLSARTSDYLKIFNEFARTGQNDVDSFALANTATLLQNISELTADEAFSSLTAAMISFNIAAEDSVRIADRLNEVNVSAFLIRNFKVIKSNHIGGNPEMGNT